MKYSWQLRAQCYCVVSKLRLNTTSFLTVQCSRVSVVRPGTHSPCLVRVILILAGEYRHDCTTQSNRTDFFAVCRYMPLLGQSYYPRTPQDTPGHPRTHKDTQRYLYSIIFIMFINQIRSFFIECVIKLNITIHKIWSTFCLSMNSQEITPRTSQHTTGQAGYLKDNSV